MMSLSALCGTYLTPAASAQEPSAPANLALFPSDVVSSGALQLHAGTSYANTSTDETFLIGRTVLRYGVGPIELQTDLGSYVVKWGEERYSGVEDLRLGIKAPLFRSASGNVQVSGRGTLSVPTGVEETTSGDPNIMLSAMADITISDGVFASASLDWESPHFAGDESWTVSFFPGMAIPFLNGGGGLGWSGYVEEGSLDSTLLAALFIQFDQATALEMSAGRSVETHEFFLGARIFRLLRH